MRLRLFGLLLIAAACTWRAEAVSAGSADRPPAAEPVQKAVPAAALRCPLPRKLQPAFERAARDTRVPLALLTAVARIESRLRQSGRSRAGTNPDHAPSNVLAGARYLRLMLERFHSTDLTYVANVTALWRRLNGCR